MRNLLAIAALLVCTTAADARVYNYACNVPDEATGNTRLHPLKIDTAKHTITWRGSRRQCQKRRRGLREILLPSDP
jgi:hypothetical protein